MSQKNTRDFWNNEYKNPQYFTLSMEASGDLQKFVRWLEREKKESLLSRYSFILDAGCGNGRNLTFLARHFPIKGLGFDISDVAISIAKKESFGLPIVFQVGNIFDPIPLGDESVDIVLDLMSSHYLPEEERILFKKEVSRVLKPGGILLMKSFLSDGDIRSKKLVEGKIKGKKLADTKDSGSYIHPLIGSLEHTWKESEVYDFFKPDFNILKFEKSFGHLSHGRAQKRRYFVAYLEKNY